MNLQDMTKEELIEEIKFLRDAIRKHRDEKGHDRCWLDDQTLYEVLPETTKAETILPCQDEFLKECKKYWQNRQNPNEKDD